MENVSLITLEKWLIGKAVSDALQPPSGESEEPEGKIKKIEGQDRNEPKPEWSVKTSLVIKHGDTSMTFKFEWNNW